MLISSKWRFSPSLLPHRRDYFVFFSGLSLSSHLLAGLPDPSWLSDSVLADRVTLQVVERKWWKLKRTEDLLANQSLLSSFSALLSTAKSFFFNPKLSVTSPTPNPSFLSFLPSSTPPLPYLPPTERLCYQHCKKARRHTLLISPSTC